MNESNCFKKKQEEDKEVKAVGSMHLSQVTANCVFCMGMFRPLVKRK